MNEELDKVFHDLCATIEIERDNLMDELGLVLTREQGNAIVCVAAELQHLRAALAAKEGGVKRSVGSRKFSCVGKQGHESAAEARRRARKKCEPYKRRKAERS